MERCPRQAQTNRWRRAGVLGLAVLLLHCGEPASPAAKDAEDAIVAQDGAATSDADATGVPDATTETVDGGDVGTADAASPTESDAETTDLGTEDAQDAGQAGDAGQVDAGQAEDGQAADAGQVADAVAQAPNLLTLTVTGEPNLIGKPWMLKVIPAGSLLTGGLGQGIENGGIDVAKGPLTALPQTVQVPLPAGNWMPMALVFGDAGPAAGGLLCQGTAPLPLQVLDGTVIPPATLQLHALSGQPSTAAMCGASAGPEVFKSQGFTATPPTQWGGAHHVQGVSDGDKLWVAGAQDGLVSFDLPANPQSQTKPLANWTVHQGAMCSRIAQGGQTIFCGSRASYITTWAVNAGATKQTHVQVPLPGLTTEGLAVRQGILWIASHGKGLHAISAQSPFGPVAATVPATLNDTWDVAPLGDQHLLVADGKYGLKIMQIGQDNALTLAASLPLPGVSAYLNLKGNLALVAALGGGLHAVDVSSPAAPKLVATASLAENVFAGVQLGSGGDAVVLAATGHHVVALPMPQVGVAWRPRRALASLGYAMDVDASYANLFRISEFVGIRQVAVTAANLKPAPVLLTRALVSAKVAAVGQPITATLHLHNAGELPLHIGSILLDEVPNGKGNLTSLAGPWTVAAGQTLQLPVAMTKTVKGQLEHRALVYSDDGEQSLQIVKIMETTWLRPGDPLPPLQYADGAGKSWNVQEQLKNKVGVVLVGAQSCQVGLLGLASAGVDLQPLLQGGQVAAVAINPWDTPAKTQETQALSLPFPVTYSPLTTSDGHDKSAILDELLGQPGVIGPPMPLVYVVGKDGKLVLAQWAYERAAVLDAVQQALLAP